MVWERRIADQELNSNDGMKIDHPVKAGFVAFIK